MAVLWSSSSDCTAKVWDLASRQCVLTIEDPDCSRPVRAASFSPDGKFVVAGMDRDAKVWDTSCIGSGCVIALAGHREYVSSAVFSSQGHLVVTGSADRTARVWTGVQEELMAYNEYIDSLP